MNNFYPYVKLKELCDVNQGLQIPIDERFTENAPNRYFYITVQFLKTNHTNKFYVENPPSSSICNEDDILIVRTGSTGQIITGVSGCFHNNFFKVNFKKELIHGRYLYHCLNTKEKYRDMLRRAGVTTIPDLNHFMFLDMEIPFPKKKNQIEIAKTLDSLDSKIQLNNLINAELESMAKTLYDYWFVQFDFPDVNGKPYKTSGGKMVWNEQLKRKIPEGWEVGTLGDVAELVRGVTYGSDDIKSQSAIDVIPILRATNISGNVVDLNNMVYVPKQNVSNTQLLNKYDILITMSSGSKEHIGKNGFFYYEREASFGAFCAKIIANAEYRYYLYSFTQSDFMFTTIKNECLGTNINNLNGSLVKGFKLIIPPNELINSFNVKVNSVYEKIGNNLKENQKLTELRDWLLPMLMNGQVKVSEL
jgi:type I restriction enzyme S subunit